MTVFFFNTLVLLPWEARRHYSSISISSCYVLLKDSVLTALPIRQKCYFLSPWTCNKNRVDLALFLGMYNTWAIPICRACQVELRKIYKVHQQINGQVFRRPLKSVGFWAGCFEKCKEGTVLSEHCCICRGNDGIWVWKLTCI